MTNRELIKLLRRCRKLFLAGRKSGNQFNPWGVVKHGYDFAKETHRRIDAAIAELERKDGAE